MLEPADGSYLGAPVSRVRFSYADEGGSGIDPASVVILIDGANRTAEFVVTPTSAEATLTTPLLDVTHVLRADVIDFGGNPGHAEARVAVDTQPPVLSISEPAEGVYLNRRQVTVKGRVSDADPQVAVDCAPMGVAAEVASGEFTCTGELAEGENTLVVSAHDRFDHYADSVSREVKIDTIPPQVTVADPTPGQYLALDAVTVSGGVIDASPVSVTVAGVAAVVNGSAFTASGIPIGLGPEETLQAVAVDAAGNQGSGSVTVRVDRIAPVPVITEPKAGAWLKGPSLNVIGTVTDASPVVVEVNGTQATVSGGSFTAALAVVDGELTLVATAVDAAANRNTSPTVAVHIDSVPPQITFTSPLAGTVTNAVSILVRGTVTDASPVTLSHGGTPVPLQGNAFEFELPLGGEGETTVELEATDAAGNVGTAAVSLLVDRTPPQLEIVGPHEGDVFGSLPVLVQGTVSDLTSTVVMVDGLYAGMTSEAWQLPFASLAEGPHTFTAVASDSAGNTTTKTVSVLVDLTAPVVMITDPASGSITRLAAALVAGTVSSRSASSVLVNGVPAAVANGSFTATVPLIEGDNTLHAVARSAAGHTGDASVLVTRDSIPPVVTLNAPETVTKDRPAQATAAASDNLALAQVVLSLNGAAVTFAAPPFQIPITIPEGAKNGDTLVVTAVATDTAGNSATTSRVVKVVTQGVVTGRVLSDATTLPVAEAMVTVSAQGTATTTTTEDGEYSIPVSDAMAIVAITKSKMTSVERLVSVATGVGTVPVDARLTPLPEPQLIGAGGGTIEAGEWTLTLPAGLPDLSLTAVSLSPQGLPGLLPLGWSPVAALTLSASGALGAVEAAVKSLPARDLVLARYNLSLHDWVLVTPALLPAADGTLALTLPSAGSYALVAPDTPDVALPDAGQVMPAVAMTPIPETATSSASASPSSLPPSGGTSTATLLVQSMTPLPSGTVVAARFKETFTLASGQEASLEERLADVVLYRAGAPEGSVLAGSFPVTPSRSYKEADLSSGNVHLDILRGREGVRGKTGGSSAIQVQDGSVMLSLPAQSLGVDTVVDVRQSALSSFLPSQGDLAPLAEARVDLSNATLGLGAELSFAADGVVAGDTLLIARVERVDDVPRLMVVSLAQLQGDRVVSVPAPFLPGIRSGGRYVLYRSAQALGWISGTVASSEGGVRALLQGEGLPFVTFSDASGHYTLPALPGHVAVSAAVPGTGLAAQAAVDVVAGETASLDLALVGTVLTAAVTPADGTTGLERGVQVEITSPTPLAAATVTQANVQLLRDGQPVGVRLVLSGSGRTLAVVPLTALEFSTSYTLAVSGLADVQGALVQVPSVTFRTKDDMPPVYNNDALTFSFPDVDGLTTSRLRPGTFPPGTTILIINSGNGVVLSLTAGNDGEVAPAQMPASIDDQLMVTITDPFGNVKTFTRSQFVETNENGEPTGRVAIGPGGGTVKAIDGSGMELRIPEGALDKGARLEVKSFTLESLPEDMRQLPELEGANFGSGLAVSSPDKPTLSKEAKLVFPLPDFTKGTGEQPTKPEDAFFYVFRRLEGPPGDDGKPTVYFETIDYATVVCPEGKATCAPEEKKVETASPPFSGFIDMCGGCSTRAARIFDGHDDVPLPDVDVRPPLPGRSPYGVITGKVQQQRLRQPRATGPVPNAIVSLGDGMTPGAIVARSAGSGWHLHARSTSAGRAVPATVIATSALGHEDREPIYEMSEARPGLLRTLRKYQHVGHGEPDLRADRRAAAAGSDRDHRSQEGRHRPARPGGHGLRARDLAQVEREDHRPHHQGAAGRVRDGHDGPRGRHGDRQLHAVARRQPHGDGDGAHDRAQDADGLDHLPGRQPRRRQQRDPRRHAAQRHRRPDGAEARREGRAGERLPAGLVHGAGAQPRDPKRGRQPTRGHDHARRAVVRGAATGSNTVHPPRHRRDRQSDRGRSPWAHRDLGDGAADGRAEVQHAVPTRADQPASATSTPVARRRWRRTRRRSPPSGPRRSAARSSTARPASWSSAAAPTSSRTTSTAAH